MSTSANGGEIFSAPYVVEHTFRRSLGPVMSRFLTGLRDRRIEGIRTCDGRVMVPPKEYDPETGEDLHELVEVGESGVVKSWSWVSRPSDKHPVSRPFAWALVQLDGADTAMLHAVDAGSEDAMSTGMRVKVQWADETTGCIQDIACFVAEEN